jgi:phosphopantothenoylcysteine decarboxylase/phosphopantothenate--cysteine ligase
MLLMAAAVADFRPAQAAPQKIKKEAGAPQLSLEPTADILAAVAGLKAARGCPKVTVGFAAESQDLLENARRKLAAKRLDLIVANDITALDAGFGVDTNRVTLLDAQGGAEALPLLGKDEAAQIVVERAAALLQAAMQAATQAAMQAAMQAGKP